jgi:NADH-quinone oxidoreductase subunit N
MISLAGLPPTAGFYAKFFILTAIWDMYTSTANNAYFLLFATGILTTILSLFYYLKIPFYMFFRKSEQSREIAYNTKEMLLPIILILPLLILFIQPDSVINVLNNIKNFD